VLLALPVDRAMLQAAAGPEHVHLAALERHMHQDSIFSVHQQAAARDPFTVAEDCDILEAATGSLQVQMVVCPQPDLTALESSREPKFDGRRCFFGGFPQWLDSVAMNGEDVAGRLSVEEVSQILKPQSEPLESVLRHFRFHLVELRPQIFNHLPTSSTARLTCIGGWSQHASFVDIVTSVAQSAIRKPHYRMNQQIVVPTNAAFLGMTPPIVTQAQHGPQPRSRMSRLTVEPPGVEVNKSGYVHTPFPTNKPN
jgi:hypothetical protein